MKSSVKLRELKDRKSYKILKKAIPILVIGGLIEYALFFRHSSIANGNNYIAVDLAYVIIMPVLLISAILIFCALFALIADIIEINTD